MNQIILYAALLMFSMVVSSILLSRMSVRRSRCAIGSVLFSVMALCMYLQYGGSSAYFNYQYAQAEKRRLQSVLASVGGEDKIIQAMQAQLKEDPTSAKGWYLLGRLYLGNQHWSLARSAFEKASRLEPQNPTFIANLAHSEWQENGARFNDSIRAKFKHLLADHPGQPDALYMLAVDAFEHKQYISAIDYLKKLQSQLPTDSSDYDAVGRAIEESEARLEKERTFKQ